MADEEGERRGARPDGRASLEGVDVSVLEMDPDERDRRGIDDDEVRAALLAVARHGDAGDKRLDGVTLPGLDLDYAVVDGATNHPLDLRGATIEGEITAVRAEVRVPLLLDDATIGGLTVDEARFENSVSMDGATVEGECSGFETTFADDLSATDARFEAPVDFTEASFDNDLSFDGATFADDVHFEGATFYGRSNKLEDNASFDGATFAAEADFEQATFDFSTFAGVEFQGVADFQEVTFGGDVDFDDATFREEADFDEGDFEQDAFFRRVAFEGVADFRGAEFEGGARTLEEDATFREARFGVEADFRDAVFRGASFRAVTFEGRANFQEVQIGDDADFSDCQFLGVADFDEARFHGDVNFSGSRFAKPCEFRGAEFLGEDNVLEDDASFENVEFDDDVDFGNARFTSANFRGVGFGGRANFRDVVFVDRTDFMATEIDDDAYVDFTRAKIPEGTITQPGELWVRYDLTQASLGDVTFDTVDRKDRRELLDYFRFCNTEFTEFDGHEFDWSAHLDYLDRNDWVLHEFEENEATFDYATEMTPENVETTYLKAKNSASSAANMKAAGEFRVKRQQHSRRKNVAIARDPGAALTSRVRNGARAVENAFLGITCGHGMRLVRIATVFLVAPMFFAVPYAFFGGMLKTNAGHVTSLSQLLTPQGQAILYKNIHFSYISYTTIGYGYLGPKGWLARLMAGSEAYLSTILAALVVYALVKRSEL